MQHTHTHTCAHKSLGTTLLSPFSLFGAKPLIPAPDRLPHRPSPVYASKPSSSSCDAITLHAAVAVALPSPKPSVRPGIRVHRPDLPLPSLELQTFQPFNAVPAVARPSLIGPRASLIPRRRTLSSSTSTPPAGSHPPHSQSHLILTHGDSHLTPHSLAYRVASHQTHNGRPLLPPQ